MKSCMIFLQNAMVYEWHAQVSRQYKSVVDYNVAFFSSYFLILDDINRYPAQEKDAGSIAYH
jgi:hypothetical protein